MIINPYSTRAQKVVDKEISSIRNEIETLSPELQDKIAQGEKVIDEVLNREAVKGKVDSLNVFNLKENVSGEVMKYLSMLCSAAGYYKVVIQVDSFHSGGKARVTKYPNQISLSFKE
jgi:predicted CoA-binding protein